MKERLGWGREAIKAVGDADFQWRRHASAAKSAQAAAAPGPLRCLGEAVRISRTACKAFDWFFALKTAAIEPQAHCMHIGDHRSCVVLPLFAILLISGSGCKRCCSSHSIETLSHGCARTAIWQLPRLQSCKLGLHMCPDAFSSLNPPRTRCASQRFSFFKGPP
jgi:hypothetical protein